MPDVSGRTVYGKDGKSRTIEDKSFDAAGKPTARTRVYERQQGPAALESPTVRRLVNRRRPAGADQGSL